MLIVVVDLTRDRKREDAFKALLRELSHRSKNLLAIVQSIASQSARTSEDLNAFLTKFYGRIASLSFSQDLVTDSNWRGAYFIELANKQFSRYLADGETRVEITGDNVLLPANAATHIGLALHELIVNSTSYGTLSGVGGSVTLTSRRNTALDDTPVIEVAWDERFGTSSANRSHSGRRKQFSNVVLERIVPTAIGGSATYQASRLGTKYRLSFREA